MRDLVGKRFGRLVVKKMTDKHCGHNRLWMCECDCGESLRVSQAHLLGGHTQSCGCLHKDIVTKHGKWGCRVYTSYRKMLYRCLNKNSISYKNYGGRGIKVCKRWLESFENFYADMGDRPEGKTLDRIDNNGDYCPENCRWSSSKKQNRNTRRNKNITYKGETRCLSDWSEKTGIKYYTLWYRLNKYGWSVERALTTK